VLKGVVAKTLLLGKVVRGEHLDADNPRGLAESSTDIGVVAALIHGNTDVLGAL
jgi:hypothetical protein